MLAAMDSSFFYVKESGFTPAQFIDIFCHFYNFELS